MISDNNQPYQMKNNYLLLILRRNGVTCDKHNITGVVISVNCHQVCSKIYSWPRLIIVCMKWQLNTQECVYTTRTCIMRRSFISAPPPAIPIPASPARPAIPPPPAPPPLIIASSAGLNGIWHNTGNKHRVNIMMMKPDQTTIHIQQDTLDIVWTRQRNIPQPSLITSEITIIY